MHGKTYARRDTCIPAIDDVHFNTELVTSREKVVMYGVRKDVVVLTEAIRAVLRPRPFRRKFSDTVSSLADYGVGFTTISRPMSGLQSCTLL